MRPPGRERMAALRHDGEKPLEDGVMEPFLVDVVEEAALRSPEIAWLLTGDLAASSYTRSRATRRLQMIVAEEEAKKRLLGVLEDLDDRITIEVITMEDLGIDEVLFQQWAARARCEMAGRATVLVPRPGDLFIALLSVDDMLSFFDACRFLQVYGPLDLSGMELTSHQQQRLTQAAAAVINEAAGRIEELARELPA